MDFKLGISPRHGLLLASLLLGACSADPIEQQSSNPSSRGDGDDDHGDGDGDGDGDDDSADDDDTDQKPTDGIDAGDADDEQEDGGTDPETKPGRLPSASDLKEAGPFTPTSGAGPSGYVLFYPKELGKDGVKHPILSWGPGAAENAGTFATLLNHLASHGFAVISYDATPDGEELTKGIDWMVMENGRSGSPFYQKLDTTKIAAGGHSAGSIATFKVGADKRLITTLHISGGTFDPHTDIANLHAPALFVCGEPPVDGLLIGDVARPNCDIDFDNAKVPVFYGVTKGASHMTPTEIGDATLRSYQMAAITGWLRWQLADETGTKAMFAGNACTLCKDSNWTAKQRGL